MAPGRRARYLAIAALPLVLLVATYGRLLVGMGGGKGPEEEANVEVFLQGVSDVNTRTLTLYQRDVKFFEPCPYERQPQAFEDFTPLLKEAMQLKDSCISNLGLVSVSKGFALLSLRIYTSKHGVPCTVADAPGGQWAEAWDGYGGFGLVLIKRSLLGEAKVLAHMSRIDDTTEDARLFIDDQGKIRMLYNRYRGGDPTMRGFKRFQRRSMHTIEILVDTYKNTIVLQNEQELIYVYQERDEKNWVAWEGSTLMSYPQYPLFAPHAVLDWKSYDLAQDQFEVTALTPVPWIDRFRESTGGWIRFSGGTPGIRLDEHRFLAVGHAVGDLSCFHSEETSAGEAGPPETLPARAAAAARKLLLDVVSPGSSKRMGSMLSAHKCDRNNPAPDSHMGWAAHFWGSNHKLPHHHPHWEYFFFMYTWSAYFPYEITGISHAFIPDDAPEHMGVYFPSGLQRMPDRSIMLTYGKDDARTMAMTVSKALVEEWVMPLDRIDPDNYKFCSVAEHHDDGRITYTLPTYVLYDALSTEGRGDLERLYQRPTALKVFSEMLRSHLDVPWLSRYMTLPGGGRESRKVMMLKIDVAVGGTLASGIRSRLRAQTVRHSEAPVLLRRAGCDAAVHTPGTASRADAGGGSVGVRARAKRPRRAHAAAASDDVGQSNSDSPDTDHHVHAGNTGHAQHARGSPVRDAKLEAPPPHSRPGAAAGGVLADASVSTDSSAEAHFVDVHGLSEVGEQDAVAALLGLCVGKTSGGGSAVQCGRSGEGDTDAETHGTLDASGGSSGAGRQRAVRRRASTAAAPLPLLSVRVPWPSAVSAATTDGDSSPLSPPTTWPVKRSRHTCDGTRASSAAAGMLPLFVSLPSVPSACTPSPGAAATAAAAAPASGDGDALQPLACWQQQQLALGRMHARLASAAQLLHEQLYRSSVSSGDGGERGRQAHAEAEAAAAQVGLLAAHARSAQQGVELESSPSSSPSLTPAPTVSGSSEGCPSLEAHIMAPEDAAGTAGVRKAEEGGQGVRGHEREQHSDEGVDDPRKAPARAPLARLMAAVRTWELCAGTRCCQVLVADGADAVDVPHVCIGCDSGAPGSLHAVPCRPAKPETAMSDRPVRWHACAAPGCRYVLSMGQLCAEHLRAAGIFSGDALTALPRAAPDSDHHQPGAHTDDALTLLAAVWRERGSSGGATSGSSGGGAALFNEHADAGGASLPRLPGGSVGAVLWRLDLTRPERLDTRILGLA
ncbi:hypothetical protein FOA52_002941 [Chlamydomonas sp. UWO 241]|nr:hypothetical protein FOA52_002941 [Chlamydomonas sp. UWO 241]